MPILVRVEEQALAVQLALQLLHDGLGSVQAPRPWRTEVEEAPHLLQRDPRETRSEIHTVCHTTRRSRKAEKQNLQQEIRSRLV